MVFAGFRAFTQRGQIGPLQDEVKLRARSVGHSRPVQRVLVRGILLQPVLSRFLRFLETRKKLFLKARRKGRFTLPKHVALVGVRLGGEESFLEQLLVEDSIREIIQRAQVIRMLAQPRFKRLTGRQELEIIQVLERFLDLIGLRRAARRGRANLRSKRRGRRRHACQ